MSAGLDMTLDDLIKTNKKSGSGNFRGRSGPGPARRIPNRSGNRTAPYAATAKAPETAWQHDLYGDQALPPYPVAHDARAPPSLETGTKLLISNLDYGVSNDDIKELFGEVGDLKRHGVDYDRSGRSKGSAVVVFSRRADAIAAVKRYNNVQLDGKPMKVEIVGANISSPSVPPALSGAFGNRIGVPQRQGRGGALRRPGGRGQGIRGNRGRGRGRGGGRDEKVSAEDLDADLEKYHAESMQLN
ncbi:THO complex subunit 4A-like isoform X2 [Lotus japonicus]|uniref:THO complex subunit 4A-like isoform X2 n=1 Tax=Lotus japonicus TaxID=34305 RepID=UPI002583B7E6|nr:THO complex subunit 4A-like isoform X2 [Lotus japonicus]